MSEKPRLRGIDVVGIVAIIGCFTMIGLGKDGTVLAILLIIVGYYFGTRRKLTDAE